jgi:periplasmic copper chaperone A
MKALLAPLFLFSTLSLAQVEVNDPLVRLLPPGVPNTAAYMELVNTASEDVRLIGAESDAVERIEIHDHQMHQGMMKMVQQQEVIVPANSSVEFKPGGLHLMMFGIKEALVKNQQVTITLIFANDSEMEIKAVVAEPRASNPHKHH